MEEKNIDELLSEEIAAQIKALSDLQSGTKEKSTAIDDLTKLYKLRIEENKSVWDADEKYNRRMMDGESVTKDKALRKIRADSKTNHDGDPEAYSKLEAVKSAWVCYIPAAISGTATIFCIFGANVLSKRQQAALTSAYALLNDSYNNYKDKLKELYGEEAHQKIVDAIAAEKAKDVYITSTGLVRNSSLDFDEHDPNDERLFYDAYSNRYFESSINRVIQAEYHLNRDFVISGYLPANHFYQLLGLEPLEGGDTVGWSIDTGIYWIDFNHSKVTLDDELEVLVIDMDWVPDAGWDSE